MIRFRQPRGTPTVGVARRRQEWRMSNRNLLALAAALALAVPAAASAGDGWSVTLGVWGGVSRYDVLGLEHGLGAVEGADGQKLLDGDAKSEVLTPLVGFAWDLSRHVRLDVLAELGGHRITGLGTDVQLAD